MHKSSEVISGLPLIPNGEPTLLDLPTKLRDLSQSEVDAAHELAMITHHLGKVLARHRVEVTRTQIREAAESLYASGLRVTK